MQKLSSFKYNLRNWYGKDDVIVTCFQSNYLLAEQCWEAVRAEDLDRVGQCLSQYWTIKKTLAPGAEPQLVKNILHVLQPYILGGC